MDLLVDHIFSEEFKNDSSFTEKTNFLSVLFGTHKYSQSEVREIWKRGIKLGIETGLTKAGLEGQKIELLNNANERQKEFIKKFYALSEEYMCSIQYHSRIGMVIIDRAPDYDQKF